MLIIADSSALVALATCSALDILVSLGWLEIKMTLIEQIEKQLQDLPTEKQTEVLDFILFLQQRVHAAPSTGEEERGQRIRAALQTLAELNTFSEVSDPVAWQKAIRQDRPLPGRAS